MEYSQVLLEMLERIKVLENKVKALEERASVSPQQQNHAELESVSEKYRGLAEYLLSSNEARVTLTYSQIEAILGFPLPDTARKFRQSFWANTKTHSYASSWMAIGYKARVQLGSDAVTFVKNLR